MEVLLGFFGSMGRSPHSEVDCRAEVQQRIIEHGGIVGKGGISTGFMVVKVVAYSFSRAITLSG